MVRGKSAEAIERDLAASALRKRAAGGRPTAQELAALRRVEAEQDEADQRRHLASVPKRLYREMSGRSDKVLLEQADRHGLPLRGKTVDLFALSRAFHDFLAANAHKLAVEKPIEGESKSQAERREKIAQANLREIRAREAAGELVPRDAVTRLFVQHVSEAKAIFDQVPDRVLAALPKRLKPGVRRQVQEDVRKVVDDTCHALADLLSQSRLPEESPTEPKPAKPKTKRKPATRKPRKR